ncbi:MAG: DUF4832 domain-containing protein [Fibrobacter sp.]|nr:DUF4832 domain-containing protein [Fibrobacter sp.]
MNKWIISGIALATLTAATFAKDRSVALEKSIESLEPLKGIVFWPDQADDQKDLQGSISLEFSYCLPCAVVKGKSDDKIEYDWSSFEKLLDGIKSRGHQAIVRFRIEYPGESIQNAPNCTEKVVGATAVPKYIKEMDGYNESKNDVDGDGVTYYANWGFDELQWFYKQFYADFAAKYDNDPRIAFVQVGFGHWAEYHIYGTTITDSNFASKDYQTEFLKHVDKQFKETPWSISIDAADDEYTPIVASKDLMKLHFGLFDDSFMHKEHDISQGDGDNEKNWQAIGENRWKTAPAGGEISYYEDKDQHEFLNPDGLYGVTWEKAAEKYHMTYVIGNDAPEGKYATKDRVYEASSYAGYKFEITGYTVNKVSAAVRVKNVGIAPLYHNAYVTVKGVRSKTSLKGLLPGEEATFTVSGIEIGDKESPEPSITSDKLLEGATIPYKASLDGSEETIEGTADEDGKTSIRGARIGYSNREIRANCTTNRCKSRATDLKGRNVPSRAAHKARGAYFSTSKR